MLLCTHNPSPWRFKDSIRVGRQRCRCRPRYQSLGAESLEFSRAAPVTWYPFMITWNHMDGEDGREGAIRPGRQLLSWLKAVAEVWLTCPASAASPRAATLVTPKAGCHERHPSRGQSLADRGAVVIVSPEQLSHFAAPTECLTCFSASIGHISQGEAGVVDTDGSDLHAIDALNTGEWRYLS